MRGEAAADTVRERLEGLRPRVAIVLGSGLGALADAVEDARTVPYHDIPGFPDVGVTGHVGNLVAGVLGGVPVVLQSGRFHLYEGHAPQTVAFPVRVFAELGVGALIITNAAGGLQPTMRPPALMLIADHLNLTWRNPLIGPVVTSEERFPDMSQPYDAELRTIARQAAAEAAVTLEEGVYAGVLGPSYETPAEVRMLARLGADAVGMSTVPEVLAARARGLRVLGISSITNWAAGIGQEPLSHEDVLAAAAGLMGDLEALVRRVVSRTVGR